MAYTVRDLIKTSLRKIRVLGSGEALQDNDGADAKEALTAMVDAWTLESLLVPVVGVVTFQLLSNVSEYTIGIYPDPVPSPLPENHIEVARPEKIVTAFIRDQYSTDYIQSVMYADTFAGISRKTNGSRPSRFYIRKGWPLNTILFESAPYADETLHLEVISPLSEVLSTASLDTVINLPPGYRQALIYNLAVLLATEFGKSVTSDLAVFATQGKRHIKRSNYRPITLGVDKAIASQRRASGTYIIDQGP